MVKIKGLYCPKCNWTKDIEVSNILEKNTIEIYCPECSNTYIYKLDSFRGTI